MISESDPHKNDFLQLLADCPLLEVQVNLIPLIGKADSFTKEELQEFKQNVFSSSFPRIFQKGQKIFFPFKFPSDLQPTGKREDLIPQLHHVPQPG